MRRQHVCDIEEGLCLQVHHVLQEVARCQATDSHLGLADIARTYSALRAGYRDEYLMYNLAAAALAQVSASRAELAFCS